VDTPGTGFPVAVLDWPRERHVAEHLAALGRPRLLLVAEGAEPPYVDDLLEDWLRLPAEERDLRARVAALRRRAGLAEAPVFDGDCRLSYRGAWAPLSPIEFALATVLVERFGRLVNDEDLAARAWTASPPGGATLRVHLTRLRRRIGPVGLEIRTVRSRGHVMQAVSANHAFAG
jgi:DNA-binding response OmpR family regulator